MTTYTLTAEQREQLLNAFESVAGKGKRCEAAEKLLQSLQPNTQEPVAWIARHTSGHTTVSVEFAGIYRDTALSIDPLYTHQAPQQPAKTNWSELVQWWESGGEQWDVLQNIVTRMVNTAAPQKPLTDEQIEKCVEVVWGSYADFCEVRQFTRAIEAAHNIRVKL